MSETDNKTVVLLADRKKQISSQIKVDFPSPDGRRTAIEFRERFVVGRDRGCEVCVRDDGISRRHFDVFYDGRSWWIRDLDSSNGTYVDGSRIHQAPLTERAKVEFFDGGPVVYLSVVRSGLSNQFSDAGKTRSESDKAASAGTSAVHSSSDLAAVTRKHRRQFFVAMATMTILLAVALGVILYQHQGRGHALALAEKLFYETKSLELELARLKRELAQQPATAVPTSVVDAGNRLQAMQERYANLAKERELIGGHRSKEDLLIFRIARIFGEYDLSIPDNFVSEVKRYIHTWRRSERLPDAVARISQNDRAAKVVAALRKRDLPPQFLYLAVQESNFKTDAIGPQTRFGIAKGMWQFIPRTATKFGLAVGPLKDQRRYDPRDERFDFEKSTEAAAEYLRFLYTTEAQASGLLVMSAYNWGEGNIERIVNRLPENPAKRNFWRLLETQMIPDETYSYVLSIFAAAVIGEDPEHFGFSFQNPLRDL